MDLKQKQRFIVIIHVLVLYCHWIISAIKMQQDLDAGAKPLSRMLRCTSFVRKSAKPYHIAIIASKLFGNTSNLETLPKIDEDCSFRRNWSDIRIKCNNEENASKMIRIPFMGTKHQLFCYEPTTTKQIFQLEAKGDLQTFLPQHFELLIGERGFILLKGCQHKRIRRYFEKYFTHKAMQYRYNIIHEATQTLLDSLLNLTLQNQNEYANISEITKTWSWQISMNIILGNDLNICSDKERQELLSLLSEWRVGLTDTNITNANKNDTLLGRALIARDKICRHFANIWQRAKTSYLQGELDEKCMLFGLLTQMFDDEEEGIAFLSEEELFNGLIIIFHASYDTTASSCCNVLSVFYEYPQIFMRVRQYCDTIMTGLDYDTLVNDMFLTRFVEEVLRYRPPVINVTKKAINDCVINGYFVPKNELITVCMALQGINDVIYPNPDKFDMDRPVEYSNNNYNKVKHKYDFTPFSSGNKKCLGMKLAMMELKMLTVMFSTTCDFQIDEKRYKPTLDTTRYVYDVYGRFYSRK